MNDMYDVNVGDVFKNKYTNKISKVTKIKDLITSFGIPTVKKYIFFKIEDINEERSIEINKFLRSRVKMVEESI